LSESDFKIDIFLNTDICFFICFVLDVFSITQLKSKFF
jgi:hypothetical protein